MGLLAIAIPFAVFVFLIPSDDEPTEAMPAPAQDVAARPDEPASPSTASPDGSTSGSTQPAPPRPASNAPTAAPAPAPRPVVNEPDLSGYYIVGYEFNDYICKEGFDEFDKCSRYFGGPAPIMIGAADLFCSETLSSFDCAPYDPARYFELGASGRTYLCAAATMFSRYDCEVYTGGPPPISGYRPALYCSGSEWAPDCSEYWYPVDLQDYELSTINGREYLCEDAWSYGDVDCHQYDGGNPSFAVGSFPDLKCSEIAGRLECATDAYPSEYEDVAIVRIDGSDHLCEDTFYGQECFRWYGSGSPSNVMLGLPDYYCNSYGCDRYGYP